MTKILIEGHCRLKFDPGVSDIAKPLYKEEED
jgi:hypothetical protein